MVALAGDKLDERRRRTQRETTGGRGRKDDPLYKARLLLRTGAGLVTDRGWERLEQLFADPQNTPVEVMWGVYQKIVAAYRAKTSAEGKQLMSKVIDSLTTGVPDALEELKSLGKTLTNRRGDIIAYFDHPGTSNGPTEAVNAPPGAPTRHRPRIQKPSQQAPYAASSTPEASDNSYYTPKREEPHCPYCGDRDFAVVAVSDLYETEFGEL